MSVRTVTVGDRNISIGDFSGRKGARLLRLLDHVGQEFPDIQKEIARYTKEYEANHTIDLDRAFARAEWGPQPLMREEPVLDEEGRAIADDRGQPLVRREPVFDEHGQVTPGLDPLGHLTDADWEASGQKLKRPRSPGDMEVFLAIFPKVLDAAENEVAKLLGLVAMPNDEVTRRSSDGSLWDEVAAQGDHLLDAPFDQLIELLVAASEAVSEQYQEKVRSRLGERLETALRTFGLNRLTDRVSPGKNSTQPASKTSPTSSTDSPLPTDGTKSNASTELVGDGSGVS